MYLFLRLFLLDVSNVWIILFFSFLSYMYMDNSHISDKILILNKIIFLEDMFLFNADKSVLFDYTQSSKKITYILHNMYSITATYEFSFCYRLSSYWFKGLNIYKLKTKLHSNYLSFTMFLHWTGNILPASRE